MQRDRLLGLLLMILGILFGLRSMGLFPSDLEETLFRWEFLLIGIGLYAFLFEGKKGTGLTLLVIGGLFLLPELIAPLTEINFWPILLIALGALLFYNSRRKKDKKSPDVADGKGGFQESVLFGSNERIISNPELHKGELSVIFGDSRVDLTRSRWSEQGDRSVQVLILFGSSTIHVPPEWDLEVEVTSVFGSFKDLRSQKLEGPSSSDKQVRIKGLCLFGDGKIRE